MYKITSIDGEEINYDITDLVINIRDNEAVGTLGFIGSNDMSFNCTMSKKSARKLMRLFKEYKKPQKKLDWRDIPVKSRGRK